MVEHIVLNDDLNYLAMIAKTLPNHGLWTIDHGLLNKFLLLKKISEPLPETKLPYICN